MYPSLGSTQALNQRLNAEFCRDVARSTPHRLVGVPITCFSFPWVWEEFSLRQSVFRRPAKASYQRPPTARL